MPENDQDRSKHFLCNNLLYINEKVVLTTLLYTYNSRMLNVKFKSRLFIYAFFFFSKFVAD